MSFNPTGNQFGQIVTCVAAAQVMAMRFGGIVDFGSFTSHYKDELTRQRIVEASGALFDAQWIGDSALVYMGNVFGADHMGDSIIISSREDTDIVFNPVKSVKLAGRIQHMSVRMAVRRVQNDMARFGQRHKSKAFSKVEMPVTLIDDGVLHFGICFDGKVETGFIVSTADARDATDSLQYASETMKKLADCITEMWPNVISGFSDIQASDCELDEFSEVRELRKANPIWGTW
ncbi:TPA: hypothetical protein MB324_002111 [Klebsiella pneumoniae]|nr:hypothetical protein [Klebsiella pneumoniae]